MRSSRRCRQRRLDLLQRDPDLGGDPDEGHPAQFGAFVPALVAAAAAGPDQAQPLVVTQRRRGHAAACRQLTDREGIHRYRSSNLKFASCLR